MCSGAVARAPRWGWPGSPRRTGRYREAINLLADYVVEKGYALKFAIEPKPN
jgi:hypothetical protein